MVRINLTERTCERIHSVKKMSKKNNLTRRKNQYAFDLKSNHTSKSLSLFQFRPNIYVFLYYVANWIFAFCKSGEKEEKEKLAKKLQAKKNKMKVTLLLFLFISF